MQSLDSIMKFPPQFPSQFSFHEWSIQKFIIYIKCIQKFISENGRINCSKTQVSNQTKSATARTPLSTTQKQHVTPNSMFTSRRLRIAMLCVVFLQVFGASRSYPWRVSFCTSHMRCFTLIRNSPKNSFFLGQIPSLP